MMPRSIKYVIGILFVLRVVMSFTLSDGLFKSDGIAFFGAVVNLGLNGSISSIQPEQDDHFRSGAEGEALFAHLAGLRNPLYLPLPYQWLHAALYAPILFFWNSLTPVILINNMLFFGAGILFFRAASRHASAFAQAAGWIVYASFPPFFYLTSHFFSEPLFLFLLGGIVLLVDKLGVEQFFFLFIGAAAVSLTRPFGIIIAAALIVYSLSRMYYARAVGLFAAVMLAVGINAIVMQNAVPQNARIVSVSAAETFYLANSAEGDGDNDDYFVMPQAARTDTVLEQYRTGSMSGAALICEAVEQNLHAPGRFLRNSVSKLGNYFFSVVPEQWVYPSARQHAVVKNYLWIGQNLVFFALAGIGLFTAKKDASVVFLCVFTVALVFHFLLLARYRSILPILVYAAAFIPLAIDLLLRRGGVQQRI